MYTASSPQGQIQVVAPIRTHRTVWQWVDLALFVVVPIDWAETRQGVETIDVHGA